MSNTTCYLCKGKRGLYLYMPHPVPAVCPACNADGAVTPDLPDWDTPRTPEMSESAGPVAWCSECYRERVQVDFRKARQLCPDCETEAREAA
jgi:hypothetical protein